MISRWGDDYLMIGPYNPQTSAVEFEEAPAEGAIKETLEIMARMGIPCKFGRWLITGRPQVVLIDFLACFNRLGDFKRQFWENHHIGIPDDREAHDVLVFGYLCAEFLQQLTAVLERRRREGRPTEPLTWPVVAHFHEWMAGVPLPVLRHRRVPVRTVFTTHATLLGRYLSAAQVDLYAVLDRLNADQEAHRYRIFHRYAIERAAAHGSEVFTTVSEVTAKEAERLLGRRPDVVTPNGLNIQRFAAVHEFQNLHRVYKEKLHDFTMGHFFPSYTFDLNRTLYLFTAGRYEYRNKGYDIFIESLARLNWQLKQAKADINVVAFIITKAGFRNVNVGVLQSHIIFNELRNTCRAVQDEMGAKLFHTVAYGKIPSRADELLDEYAIVRLKRVSHAWRQKALPTIVTHDIENDANDPILRRLRDCKLFNTKEDPVKVVFHPDFLTAANPLFGMDYSDFVRGCHLGVFPSYYEPWGYTPMECMARGVPAVTTDLAGFGSYVLKHVPDPEDRGLFVVKRLGVEYNTACDQLTNTLRDFCLLNQRQRIELRNRVEALSEHFDWNNLARYYSEAHELAMRKM
jgi:glycogen(starch) synthase